MANKKPTAELVKHRKGRWVVKITLKDGFYFYAWPGNGGSQKVVYDHPDRVPHALKQSIVPQLINEAKIKQARGE